MEEEWYCLGGVMEFLEEVEDWRWYDRWGNLLDNPLCHDAAAMDGWSVDVYDLPKFGSHAQWPSDKVGFVELDGDENIEGVIIYSWDDKEVIIMDEDGAFVYRKVVFKPI